MNIKYLTILGSDFDAKLVIYNSDACITTDRKLIVIANRF